MSLKTIDIFTILGVVSLGSSMYSPSQHTVKTFKIQRYKKRTRKIWNTKRTPEANIVKEK
jgi:hypothetical protein